MNKGNVLVLGNSGVGKSTLINAVTGKQQAKADWGITGVTKNLFAYEGDDIPFRIIDTIGFEPSVLGNSKAINAVKKWSKESAKEDGEDNQINVIWFCVDGTAAKLFDKTIKDLSKATKMWESVPVIVVITKSYSQLDRVKNTEMVNNAFATQKGISKNLRKVIPVVAETFNLTEEAFAAPEGIIELINATNELIPEGLRAAKKDVDAFKLKRKRSLAQSIIGASTTAAAVVGAVPVPFPDATILAPLEITEITALSKVYEIKKDDDSKLFIDSIVKAGSAGIAAKQVIVMIKAIPGINIAGAVINAVVAASLVAAIGEGSVYAFEQVYSGEKTVKDIDWIKKLMESKLSNEFADKVAAIVEELNKKGDKADVPGLIADLVSAAFGVKEPKQIKAQ